MEIDKNLAMLEKFANSLIEFGVTYGFQIVGALVFLFVGLCLFGRGLFLSKRWGRKCEGGDCGDYPQLGKSHRFSFEGLLVRQ